MIAFGKYKSRYFCITLRNIPVCSICMFMNTHVLHISLYFMVFILLWISNGINFTVVTYITTWHHVNSNINMKSAKCAINTKIQKKTPTENNKDTHGKYEQYMN